MKERPPKGGRYVGGGDTTATEELDRIEREIAATDQEIDELVYVLYGIAEEERKIVEESMGAKQG